MLIVNNKALKITNKWLNPVAGSGPSPEPPTPTYYHVYTSGTNGSVVAVPASGISGTTVTLSNTPDTGYEFDSYSITGATLYDTNKFDIDNSNVNVVGNFIAIPEPVYINPYTISDDPISGYIGAFANWYKSQLTNAGGTYNSTYKLISDNMPSNIDGFDITTFDSSYERLPTKSYNVSDASNCTFSFSDLNFLTQANYNKLYYFTINFYYNQQFVQMPSDIKLQLLS